MNEDQLLCIGDPTDAYFIKSTQSKSHGAVNRASITAVSFVSFAFWLFIHIAKLRKRSRYYLSSSATSSSAVRALAKLQ
jgi:hypothetical protein